MRHLSGFWSVMPISREQAAVALAAGAVACLSSAIIHWSCGYSPPHDQPGHQVFGDLADADDGRQGTRCSSVELVPRAASAGEIGAEKENTGAHASSTQKADRQNRPKHAVSTIGRSDITLVGHIATAASESDSKPLPRNESHQRVVWFCGGIEEASVDVEGTRPTSNRGRPGHIPPRGR